MTTINLTDAKPGQAWTSTTVRLPLFHDSVEFWFSRTQGSVRPETS